MPRADAEARRYAACCELVFDVAHNSGEVRLKVTGSSMLPTVRPDDLVTVRGCEFADLHAGHIVVFGLNRYL